MKRMSIFGAGMAAGVLCAGLVVVAPSIAGDERQHSQEAESAAWMEFMTPGEHHHRMAKQFVGDWEITSKMWMAPEMPPQTSQLEATVEPIMGGRYLRETVRGDWQGMPWDGVSISGYDNIKKAPVFAWFDSMSTGIMYGEGEISADGKTYTYKTGSPNPMSGEYEPMKMETHVKGMDKHVAKFFKKAPDGSWWLHMELTYERKG